MRADIAEGAKPPPPSFNDPLHQTFGVVEAGPPVPWTKPADIEYDPKKAFPELAGPYADVLHASFCDGTAVPLRRDLGEKTLRALVGRNDGVTFTADEFKKLEAGPPAVTADDRIAVAKWREDSRKQLDELVKVLQDEIKLRDDLGLKADEFFLRFFNDPTLPADLQPALDPEAVQRFLGPRKELVERMRKQAEEFQKKNKK